MPRKSKIATIQHYSHGKERRNNPTAEQADTAAPERITPKPHRHAAREIPDIEPRLEWTRESLKKTTLAPLLTTVEKIHPGAWHQTLVRRATQLDLWEGFNGFADPERARIEWYDHTGHWVNRLIHGEARRAMASLLHYEHLGKSVQCIYMDPPYGMDFDARYMSDTVAVSAFRDSYHNGIHSYLDTLRETLTLARELLAESGSLFMQIGDINIHRAALVLDEIFGPENRVSTISYGTTGGGSSTKSIPKAGDYILWYSRNRERMLYQPLYERQTVKQWLESNFNPGVDLSDCPSRSLTAGEKNNPESLPTDAILWRMSRLTSQGPSDGEQGKPFIYNGVQYGPEGLDKNHWRVDQAGLQTLADTGRLWSNVEPGTNTASADQLHLKIYREEMPGRRLNNLWPETIADRNKQYVVQTGRKAIERCVLMTTRPGDLVLDPMGGSGTTAVVSETWGRRWISIDSSRDAIAVARERILTTAYPAHLMLDARAGRKVENALRREHHEPLLQDDPGQDGADPGRGFVLERQTRVTAATLAYADRPDKAHHQTVIHHVNRPLPARGVTRVASPFIIDSERLVRYITLDDARRGPTQAARDQKWASRCAHAIVAVGIGWRNGRRLDVQNLVEIDPSVARDAAVGLTHTATLTDRQSGKQLNGLVAVLPEDVRCTIGNVQKLLHTALTNHGNSEALVVVALDFDTVAEPTNDQHSRIPVIPVRANTDLQIREIAYDAKTPSLPVVGEPALTITKTDDGFYTVTVTGWLEYNPLKDETHSYEAKRIRSWSLDTAYDRSHFLAHEIHITHARTKTKKELRKILGSDADIERLTTATGMTSQPFPAPSTGEICIRIIIDGGDVLTAIRSIP